ncbi:lasso peptide biosynthesis B2 protein [Luteimonas viscosa]|uniref:Lasso peptide biosynthesis B2 protein n=1 Tax=Luteimonas viscosa TaxID=1132694 RepID=A0A5D4XR05_9GAMM|nr:lasso peptide biosynthesis B2 protein [Luteimonas viscosa]TYT26171.1 lasso peptide biosynthesis B2 protein [Luteimonas viscosa]
MRYRIRDDLSFCVIDSQAIFLDIESDRYFRLPADLERSFLSWERAGGKASAADLLKLADLGVVVPAVPTNDKSIPSPRVDVPARSALELQGRDARSATALVPEVLIGVLARRRELRRRRLRDVLADTARDRQARLATQGSAVSADRDRLIELAQRFRRARLHVPIEPCCLPDSLALVGFLARRRIVANIVFGVTCEPFAAHCWVQAGDMVLNDTVGNALAHTPIRVL